jgi:hypothetical protein
MMAMTDIPISASFSRRATTLCRSGRHLAAERRQEEIRRNEHRGRKLGRGSRLPPMEDNQERQRVFRKLPLNAEKLAPNSGAKRRTAKGT